MQTQKPLTPAGKPNRFNYKGYKGRWILKFKFVFTRNDGDCDARWSISFCLSIHMDNLLGMNQAKYLTRPIIMIITIIRIKIKTRT